MMNYIKKETLSDYLSSIVGKKLFKEDQNELKNKFKEVGLKDRTMGINTLNGKLMDMALDYKIISKRVKEKGELYTVWIVTC